MDDFMSPAAMERSRARRAEAFYVKVLPAADEIDAWPIEYDDAVRLEFAISSNMRYTFVFSTEEAVSIADALYDFVNQGEQGG